ncbi:glycosyltransferase family A protein [Polaribacter undariae]|uniref:Glycosyltransferase family A protein n=1 Tax=Polaribacter sejongensis TaxID=985043 RepID=A0AAJ1VH25_9FLAO|nr:glycosyltransferase family A protein [Polaribacter undariae]MDN3619889.1 glycosyltransferase family A protein [Polaribacter undariae]UWD31651.1 glycosyltransferase family 2 protein [Polaribacter undariae]
MLSVLIPTYNYNTFFLVKEIHQQLILEDIEFEIICLDDGSKSPLNEKNKDINKLSFSSFKSLENNIGRSAIRNLLAKKAIYNWLLFLDADVIPVKSNFIKNYIHCFKKDKTVFCGGLLYEDKKENFGLLRYKFGKRHEEISVEKRIENPEKFFFTSNFLIQNAIFADVIFEEKLTQYGREDLLFSLELIKKGFIIEHISNEVYHLGLDKNDLFVSKTKKAMENLIFIDKQSLIDTKEMPLLELVRKISILKMTRIVGMFHLFFEKLAIKKSSVFFLNCMKVSYMCHLKLKHE